MNIKINELQDLQNNKYKVSGTKNELINNLLNINK